MRSFRLKEIYVRWLGIPVVALVSTLATDHATHLPYWQEYLYGLAFTTLYWTGAFWIFMGFRKVFPHIHQTGRRLTITIISLILWLTFGGAPLKILFGFMTVDQMLSLSAYLSYAWFNLIAGFSIGMLYETAFFFENWKEAIRLNEQLKNQQIRTQFEVLQNQMSPHFLFNSLNTLTTLIAENQEIAIEFTQKLSEVYRYILQNKERELVPLSEELEFAQNYVFLLQMRYPDNLHVKYHVANEYQQTSIAPLTLQILIENAIKHNVVSKAHPLTIEVYVENGKSIVVKNNLQVKHAIEKSTKTGLANISKRYEYLGNRKIDVIVTAKNYMVGVPLINLVEEKQFSVAI